MFADSVESIHSQSFSAQRRNASRKVTGYKGVVLTVIEFDSMRRNVECLWGVAWKGLEILVLGAEKSRPSPNQSSVTGLDLVLLTVTDLVL